MATKQEPLHILFFPFFAPGHLHPVADMAVVFAARGARCTILTTPVNADIVRPAIDRANDSNLGSPAIGISLMPFPVVGLPPGVENAITGFMLGRLAALLKVVRHGIPVFDAAVWMPSTHDSDHEGKRVPCKGLCVEECRRLVVSVSTPSCCRYPATSMAAARAE